MSSFSLNAVVDVVKNAEIEKGFICLIYLTFYPFIAAKCLSLCWNIW